MGVKHRFSLQDLISWHADLVVNHTCGCGCEFCIDAFVDSTDKVVDLEDVELYLRYLAEVERKEHPDMSSVLLLGGEPTKAPFGLLKDIAALVHHYGFNVCMTTNGTAGDRLLELDGHLDFINISHYGAKAIMDAPYIYRFKDTEITLSKLITTEFFPTRADFDAFIDDALEAPVNYRFSTLQENTPLLDKLHPSWVDDELLPETGVSPVLECLNAAEYRGYIIKLMHYHRDGLGIDFPPYGKLYPNGNVNRDFAHEEQDPGIHWRPELPESGDVDAHERMRELLGFGARNHWLERSLVNHEMGIENPIFARVLGENDTMVVMSVNKCFVPGTVSIASKEFHLSPFDYSEKEREDLDDMIDKVQAFLYEKTGVVPIISEHAGNHYHHVKDELCRYVQLVPDAMKGEVCKAIFDSWNEIVKGDSGIHSHSLVIPYKVSDEGLARAIEEAGMHPIAGRDEFYAQDPDLKYDLLVDNDGRWFMSNDDEGSYYYKPLSIRHAIARETGIPYLPSKPASNLAIYEPIIEETVEMFADFDEFVEERYAPDWRDRIECDGIECDDAGFGEGDGGVGQVDGEEGSEDADAR